MRRLSLLGPALLLVGGMAGASTPEQEDLRDPQRNFEYVWTALDRNYAQFGAKEIDWDALEEHKALVNAQIDAELDMNAENSAEDAGDGAETVETVEKAA